MRLTLKNTFLSVDYVPDGNEANSSSESFPSPDRDRESLGSQFGSPLRRSRSVECLSPGCDEFPDPCIQLDRLNCLLTSPLRPAKSLNEQSDAFCMREASPEGLSSSTEVCSGHQLAASEDDVPGPPENDKAFVVLRPSSEDRAALDRKWSSCNSVSTMASVGQKEYCHKNVPRHINLEEQYRNTAAIEWHPTTLMIRNIPNRYTQTELLEELENIGMGGGFDFLYLPLDRSSRASVGYAFVNFVSYSWAELCRENLEGHTFRLHGKGKQAVVSTAHLQGLEANLAHYEKTAVTKSKRPGHRPLVIARAGGEVLPPPR